VTNDQPTRELPGGARMPVLGLGVWRMAAGAETERAVEYALEVGYRHIDTASMYRNEESVGKAVRRSGVPREEIFVTTKLYPTHPSAERELEKSLKRLGLDYVDLYLIHWPVPVMTARYWRQLAKLHERRHARAIGVSNFRRGHLESLDAPVPAVNQVHFSPFHFRRALRDYCEDRGIVIEAYSPLEQGRALGHSTIMAVADRLGRTSAQVMLRWAVQQRTVVIPKSSRPERIRSNAQIFDFELSEDDMETLSALDRARG
jgi:diketogulonate reductase-like aldo/keto reductase